MPRDAAELGCKAKPGFASPVPALPTPVFCCHLAGTTDERSETGSRPNPQAPFSIPVWEPRAGV